MPDNPLNDPVKRAAYLDPTVWSDDPSREDILGEVTAYYQAKYPDQTDVSDLRRQESLRQIFQRVDDHYARTQPDAYYQEKGIRKYSLDEWVEATEGNTGTAPADMKQYNTAAEVVRLTAKGSPYWDRYHPDHAATVEKVTALFEKVYGV